MSCDENTRAKYGDGIEKIKQLWCACPMPSSIHISTNDAYSGTTSTNPWPNSAASLPIAFAGQPRTLLALVAAQPLPTAAQQDYWAAGLLA